VFVVVAYGKLIPQSILDLPRKACLNVHPSLLPRYRGPSPLQQAIVDGKTETGISIMLLDAGMDTGPILVQTVVPMDAHETYQSLQKKILYVGPLLLQKTLHAWLKDEIKPIPQDNTQASITTLLRREHGKIDWSKTAQEIDQKMRAYETWPGTWFSWNEQGKEVRISIRRASISDRAFQDQLCGQVTIDGSGIFVVCGNHTSIELVGIQPEGKKEMFVIDYVHGHPSFGQARL
jgi:methionyl-tRNA formyltransferase